jgi:hypothetical protein
MVPVCYDSILLHIALKPLLNKPHVFGDGYTAAVTANIVIGITHAVTTNKYTGFAHGSAGGGLSGTAFGTPGIPGPSIVGFDASSSGVSQKSLLGGVAEPFTEELCVNPGEIWWHNSSNL